MYQQQIPQHYGHPAYPSYPAAPQPPYAAPPYGFTPPPFDASSFRREFSARLAELTMNSRPIIHNLSMLAQNFTRYSDIVADCLQAHFRRVSVRVLFCFLSQAVPSPRQRYRVPMLYYFRRRYTKEQGCRCPLKRIDMPHVRLGRLSAMCFFPSHPVTFSRLLSFVGPLCAVWLTHACPYLVYFLF